MSLKTGCLPAEQDDLLFDIAGLGRRRESDFQAALVQVRSLDRIDQMGVLERKIIALPGQSLQQELEPILVADEVDDPESPAEVAGLVEDPALRLSLYMNFLGMPVGQSVQ
jgi:hypothetical protein